MSSRKYLLYDEVKRNKGHPGQDSISFGESIWRIRMLKMLHFDEEIEVGHHALSSIFIVGGKYS